MPDNENENLLNTQELEDSVSIDNLTQSPDLDGDDVVVLVHENNGVKSTYKAILRSIANFINKLLHYSSDLHTQDDTIIGAINELADGGASADITTEITTPAPKMTFADGGDGTPLKSCNVAIVAQQASGTPSPSSPLSISGYDSIRLFLSGKNFLDTSICNRNYTSPYTFFRFGGTNTSPVDNSLYLAKGTYTFSISTTAYVIRALDKNNETIEVANNANKLTFTLTESQKCMLNVAVSGDVQISDFTYQLELGEDATTYEAYKGTTHTMPLGQTIYGGAAELVGGSGVKRYGYILLNGSENWSEYPQQNGFSVTLTDSVADSTDMMCNRFPIVSTVANFGLRLTQSQLRFCHITDNISGVTDLATWKTWLSNNNVQVVYPLLNDTAFAFGESDIPTLSGLNNIYADCGNLQSLEYFNAGADDIDSLIDLETREFKKGKKVKFDITASHPNNPTAYSIVVKVAGNSVFSKAYTCNTYGVFAETTDYFVYDGEIYTVVAQGFQANTNQKMLTFAINDESYEVKCSASNSSYATEDSFSLKVGEGVDASDVYYDNSTSGLTATNLQDAIDEIVSMMQ